MSDVKEIRDERGALLGYRITGTMPDGLKAYTRDSDFVQVMSWHYPRGKKLQAHVHKIAPRSSNITQEVIVVLKGRVRADVYRDDRSLLTQFEVGVGECAVFLAGGHGYEILEDGTQVYEIKNGPFLGVEADKEKF